MNNNLALDYIDGEIVKTPRNPGTANNQERSGDRDPYFSWLMRQPSRRGVLRSCDFDGLPDTAPTGYCHLCALPFLMIEATRSTGYKETRYTKTTADELKVESFLVRHSGHWGSDKNGADRVPSPTFEVTRLGDGESKVFQGEKEFIAFVERVFERHWQKRHAKKALEFTPN